MGKVPQIMKYRLRQLFVLPALFVLANLSACAWLAGGSVVESALVVHTAGSKKHTAAAQIPVPAPEVFAAVIQLVEDKPDLIVESRNDKAFLIEVTAGSQSLTGQVTSLGADRSLLYVWADAGESGVTGEVLATSVVGSVCDELGVKYELVHY
jgi:hypothetical protein